MATENQLWGEEPIAKELPLKLGLRVSPRNAKRSPGRPRVDHRWSTFTSQPREGIVACDFSVSVTATFRLFYVFLLIEHGSRWLVHFTITQHPTAAWTLRQLREIIGCGDPYSIVTFCTMATASSSCTSSPSSASGLELIDDREPADPLAGRGEDRVAQRGRNRRYWGLPDTAERQAEVRRNQVRLNVARCDVSRAVFAVRP
jgi:hypothetical protein